MGLKKQCMRGKDIYELLLEKGFQISYPSVCKYIASFARYKEEAKSKEAFIRGYYPPGESCEFDWGEVKLYLDGKLQRLYIAVFTLSHSNGRYAWLFRHQESLAADLEALSLHVNEMGCFEIAEYKVDKWSIQTKPWILYSCCSMPENIIFPTLIL